MSACQQPRISGSKLRSFICLAIALPPTLMIAAALRAEAAQNECFPGNQFAYVADQGSGKILGYVLNSANGKLTPVAGSPFSTGKSGSTSVAVDPAGKFLYATNQYAGDNDISGFRIDCDSGRLTPIPGSPFASESGPTAVAIDPSGRFAYVANLGTNNVSAYTIDERSGRLSPVTGSPFAAGTFPSALAVDPLGKDVFVTNSRSNNVSGYAINHSTGALTPLPGSPYAAQNSLERYLRILHRSNQWRARSTEWVALCRGRRGSELADRGPKWQIRLPGRVRWTFCLHHQSIGANQFLWAHAGLRFALRRGKPNLRGGRLYWHISLRSKPVFERYFRV
jgi:hypothetical protein